MPEGDRRSIIRLQNDLAAAQSQERELASLIWIQKGMDLSHKQQQRFINHPKINADSHFGGKFLNTGALLIEQNLANLNAIKAAVVKKQLDQAELIETAKMVVSQTRQRRWQMGPVVHAERQVARNRALESTSARESDMSGSTAIAE